MKYLLIYWLIANPNNLYAATGSVLFDDQAACEAAKTTVAKNWPSPYHEGVGICVAQGTPAVVTPPTTQPPQPPFNIPGF